MFNLGLLSKGLMGLISLGGVGGGLGTGLGSVFGYNQQPNTELVSKEKGSSVENSSFEETKTNSQISNREQNPENTTPTEQEVSPSSRVRKDLNKQETTKESPLAITKSSASPSSFSSPKQSKPSINNPPQVKKLSQRQEKKPQTGSTSSKEIDIERDSFEVKSRNIPNGYCLETWINGKFHSQFCRVKS
ncbi:hypothetical protein [Mycoplasma suis]|uniref:Uncharacterized protein n=1 Tax=Mycoplasma suis (strain Illinois) TaxID=768700 RepID=F0QS23_MYCSL|nr:hypothetical protein [Mycoplasma suis]ADX98293.1 hypothetical protein MSU_0768 [Mycoplasma suis str. Illinois]